MNTKNDTKIFLSYYKLAVFMGLTPLRTKDNETLKKLYYKMFLAVLTIILLTWSIFFLRERVRIYDMISSPPFLIVDIVQNIIEIFFVCSCIGLNELRSDTWQNSLELLKTIENDFTNKNAKNCRHEKSIILCLLKNIIGIFVLLCTHLLEMSLITKTLHPKYCILNFKMFLILNELLIVGFIQNTTSILKTRYELLNAALEDMFKDDEGVEKGLTDKLMELGKIYKKLYVLTQNFNNLFGWPMFFLLFCTAFALLNCLNGLFLFDSKSTDLWKVVILNLTFACLYLVSILINKTMNLSDLKKIKQLCDCHF